VKRRIERLESQTGADKPKWEPRLVIYRLRGFECGLKGGDEECPHVKCAREKMEADAKKYPGQVFVRFVSPLCWSCKDVVLVGVTREEADEAAAELGHVKSPCEDG